MNPPQMSSADTRKNSFFALSFLMSAIDLESSENVDDNLLADRHDALEEDSLIDLQDSNGIPFESTINK